MVACAPEPIEQFRSAHPDLITGIAANHRNAIVAVGFFERVTAKIVVERFLKLSAILKGLSEREAKMVTILELRRFRGLSVAHRCDLIVAERIGFEVRETPIGVAEIGSRGCRQLIRFDGFRRSAECLQGMRHREMQVGCFGSAHQQLAVDLECLLVLAETDQSGGVGGSVKPVRGVFLEQQVQLCQRSCMFVPTKQNACVVISGGRIVGSEI